MWLLKYYLLFATYCNYVWQQKTKQTKKPEKNIVLVRLGSGALFAASH